MGIETSTAAGIRAPTRTVATDASSSARLNRLLLEFAILFLAYYVAGRLGQATSSIRSSNLGPVWPAYGIAVAGLLAYGRRAWPAVASSAFVIALHGGVSILAAAGQAGAATLAAISASVLLRRIPEFDPSLPRLRDALGLVVVGAFGSALLSSALGVVSLFAAGHQSYSGLPAAWLIYWLGDATGVLLVTPLVFTVPALVRTLSGGRLRELVMLLSLVTLACFVVFGDWPPLPGHLHGLAFVVLPFVMWGAIGFGIAGAAVTVFWVAGFATILTALGHGPFSGNTPFINAVMLDVFFTALALSGLTLAAVITERNRAQEQQVRDVLSDVNRRLQLAQEEERKRIARELHDDVSQRLALLAVDLKDNATIAPGKSARLYTETVQLASDVQALAHRLHSSKVELLGIARASRLLCTEFATQHKISVSFEEREIPREVPGAVTMCVYRVLQEALQNIAKHSAASSCHVELYGADGEIHLIVKDDGVGFDSEPALDPRGMGLVSMRERVALLNGRLSIDSLQGDGTRVHASLACRGSGV